MSLAEFARQSYVYAGLKDDEIAALAEGMDYDDEEFAVASPVVIMSITDAEHEEVLKTWRVDGRNVGLKLKGRARHARLTM